ncbi:hypothetical protein KCU93_g9643, partial [Aureobasidium melanogenum]
MRTLIIAILLAAPAFAADLTFSSDANCTGKPLYGGIGLDDTMCYDLSPDDGDTGESVLLSKLGSSEVVTFYSDSECQNPVEKFSSDTCFNPLGHLGSFQVTHTDNTTKDIVPTPVKLSNYRDLAVSSPYEIDLRFSDFFIGVSTLVTSHGLSIFAAVVACSAIDGPDPIPIAACIAVPLASILAYVGHYFLKKAGQNAQSSVELRTGRFPGRSLENTSDLNTQYMTSLIAGTETTMRPTQPKALAS